MKQSTATAAALAEFLDRYPWSDDQRRGRRSDDWLWIFELPVSAEALWPLISDTSRFNRALGLSQMQYEEEGGVLRGATVNAGVRQEWTEVPWEWVSCREMCAARDYQRGMARYVRSIYQIEPCDDGKGVRLHVYFGWIPRGVLGRLMLRFGRSWLRRRYENLLQALVAEAGAERPTLYQRSADPLSDTAHQRLTSARDELVSRGIDSGVVDRLVHHIESGDLMELDRIRVRKLAHDWDVDAVELLRCCLQGTRSGVVEMSWEVICPHCRGTRQALTNLSEVEAMARCEVCAVEFATGGATALEVTFHVHPAIREVQKIYYCAAEPATKRHIALQQQLGAGERRRVETRLPVGRWRLRCRGQDSHRMLVVAEKADQSIATWSPTGIEPLSVTPAPTLVLINDSSSSQTFVVESPEWADDALRPAHLFGLADFRDLYSEQYLGAGVQLAVGTQTILFTDIVDSTRFYATRGDPEAFSTVAMHFREVDQVIRDNGGVVVKTIGDAVMAAFSTSLDGLKAAQAIHRCFPPGREDIPVRLRISLNQGACIAVNLNAGIDYFGSTVNLAAKLQALAGAGQVSFSEAVRRAPGVESFLAPVGAAVEEAWLESRAYDQPYKAYRWDTEANRGVQR